MLPLSAKKKNIKTASQEIPILWNYNLNVLPNIVNGELQ